MTQGCLNCRWADYLKTPTGRIAKHESIKCRFPAKKLQDEVERLRRELPDSMKHVVISLRAHGMQAGDGAGCKQWTPADGSLGGLADWYAENSARWLIVKARTASAAMRNARRDLGGDLEIRPAKPSEVREFQALGREIEIAEES